MDDSLECPLCAGLGRDGRLTLYQMNASEAIYLCSRKECPYPVGVCNPENVSVQKRVPELEDHHTCTPAHPQSLTPSHPNPGTAASSVTPSGSEMAESEVEVDFDCEVDALLTSIMNDLSDNDHQLSDYQQ